MPNHNSVAREEFAVADGAKSAVSLPPEALILSFRNDGRRGRFIFFMTGLLGHIKDTSSRSEVMPVLG